MTPKQILESSLNGSVLVDYYSGSTWNDGGSWHCAILKLTDGTFFRVKMDSDYQPDILTIEAVREVHGTKKYYEALK